MAELFRAGVWAGWWIEEEELGKKGQAATTGKLSSCYVDPCLITDMAIVIRNERQIGRPPSWMR